jgi:hypothetical protein
MRKVAIMQPYFLPYMGYFQLTQSVDCFVFLDDVNYIKKGWVNRNQILVNGAAHLFTIPLQGASQNKKINELSLSQFNDWKNAFLKNIVFNYKKSPFFSSFYPVLEELLSTEFETIAALNKASIISILHYLQLRHSHLIDSSAQYKNQELKGEERIIDICKQEKATHYHNPIGGVELYNSEKFKEHQIELFFLKPGSIQYSQNCDIFVPYMSILDVLMNVSPEETCALMNQFELIQP